MTTLKPEDAKYHYTDGTHNWVAPTEAEQERWTATLKIHLDAHREQFGGHYLNRSRPRD